jgi:hypothetical protein
MKLSDPPISRQRQSRVVDTLDDDDDGDDDD